MGGAIPLPPVLQVGGIELRIACTVLAAPAVPQSLWLKLKASQLAAVMPLVPADEINELVDEHWDDEVALAQILAASGPFLDGQPLETARERSTHIVDIQLRTACVRALDTAGPATTFYARLDPQTQQTFSSQLRWWMTAETEERSQAIRHAAVRSVHDTKLLLRAIAYALEMLEPFASWTHSKPPRASSPKFRDIDTRGAEDKGMDGRTGSAPPDRDGVGFDQPLTGFTGTSDEQERPRIAIGFSREATPTKPLSRRTLVCDAAHWLWVEINSRDVKGAIPGERRSLPRMAAGAVIDVVLFAFDSSLQLDEGRRLGQLSLATTGASTVVRAAAELAGPLASRRLFFPIRTPATPGRHYVRVNLYHKGYLLQSHLVRADVTAIAKPAPMPFETSVDYAISSLDELPGFRSEDSAALSIMLNSDPSTGTHGFRFFGGSDVVGDASIDGTTLSTMIDYARGALRRAAWGTPEPWRSSDLDRYRYDAPDPLRLTDDLIALARHGYRLWAEVLTRFDLTDKTQAALKTKDVRSATLAPGIIQLSLKRGASHIFPVALVYDYPLDSSRTELTMCSAFLAAVKAGAALETSPCFQGSCPHYADKTVVCAGGFWGFRHAIGVPPDLKNVQVAHTIPFDGPLRLVISVSMDPTFTLREPHLLALQGLGATTVVARERLECFEQLCKAKPHVGYFYCHGGKTQSGTPYLEVGKRGSEMITKDNLIEVELDDPRPLIVVNGCHTTDTSPEQAFDLVTGFVQLSHAAGVIGTEITIFEPLARDFGEGLLQRFFAGDPIGTAVKRTRLALLARMNPLGLVYVPFVLPSLRLEKGVA